MLVDHEAGHLAARTRQTRTVYHKDEYKGSNSGINYPITMNDQVVGVIGITGEPNVVGQYGFLLTKICEVFMKEYLLEIQSYDDQQRVGKLVMALLYHGCIQCGGEFDFICIQFSGDSDNYDRRVSCRSLGICHST